MSDQARVAVLELVGDREPPHQPEQVAADPIGVGLAVRADLPDLYKPHMLKHSISPPCFVIVEDLTDRASQPFRLQHDHIPQTRVVGVMQHQSAGMQEPQQRIEGVLVDDLMGGADPYVLCVGNK